MNTPSQLDTYIAARGLKQEVRPALFGCYKPSYSHSRGSTTVIDMRPDIMKEPSHLANPLASVAQLETSASQLDGVPRELEDSVRYETARLNQAAGILLRLPQEIIAQSIVLLQRFWTGPSGGSMLKHDSKVSFVSIRLSLSIPFPKLTEAGRSSCVTVPGS